MVNLPLDGLLQLLANAKATGFLSTIVTMGDPDTGRMVTRGFYLLDGRILVGNRLKGLSDRVAEVGEYLGRTELEWHWQECNTPAGVPVPVETILLECARIADESKAVRS